MRLINSLSLGLRGEASYFLLAFIGMVLLMFLTYNAQEGRNARRVALNWSWQLLERLWMIVVVTNVTCSVGFWRDTRSRRRSGYDSSLPGFLEEGWGSPSTVLGGNDIPE